jgi:hypothetical protein
MTFSEELTSEMIDHLKKLASRECYFDDEDENKVVDDFVGGNVDDAFDLGKLAGETLLAREVLKSMGIEW